jgi:uncharacterized protein YndB with AHSA1/START domain
MATYEHSTPVYVSPRRLYEYLADVDHLPEYMPQIKSARRTGDDTVDVSAEIRDDDGSSTVVQEQARLEVREDGRHLAWRAPGPHDYHGELEVAETDSGESRLTVRLFTDHGDSDAVQAQLVEAVQRIRTLAEDYGVVNPDGTRSSPGDTVP